MHLLLIEDDEQLALNLKKMLEHRGFAVDWLRDASKALTRISMYRNEYAMLLLDLGLPGTDGAELTKRIRAEGISTPIIVVTGRSETSVKIELLNAGADDYLVKPFSTDELVARINSVLRRPAEQKPTVQKFGSLSIDTAARRVKAGSEEIPLTLKEYSLFECFLRRPNEVLSREELCNQVWDFNSVAWSNVLDVHMKNLRKKLRASEEAPQLETVRGVGYRLVV